MSTVKTSSSRPLSASILDGDVNSTHLIGLVRGVKEGRAQAKAFNSRQEAQWILDGRQERLPKKGPSDGSYPFPTNDISAQPCKTVRRRNGTPCKDLTFACRCEIFWTSRWWGRAGRQGVVQGESVGTQRVKHAITDRSCLGQTSWVIP